MHITVAKHKIQKYILSYLTYHHTARFRDLKPPKVTTNLFSYHLKLLVNGGMIDRDDDGYTLSTLGLAYADRVNEERRVVYQQPKIITMFIIQNSNGDLLLQKRMKQPYIDTWNLPNGKIHIDDESIVAGARRVMNKKLNINKQDIKHAGDCYIRINQGDAPISIAFAHIFTFNRDDFPIDSNTKWVQPHKLHNLELAPAVERITARTFFRDPFFFEEFEESW